MGGFFIIPGFFLCIWDTLWLTVQKIEDFMGPYVGVEQACRGQRGGGDKCRVVPSGSLIKLDLKMPAVVIIPYPRYGGRPLGNGFKLWCQNDDGVSRPCLALCLDGNISCSVSVQPGHEV